jgi:hypothetical protein
VSFPGASTYTWVGTTSDLRATQKVSSTDATNRIAACWYSGTSFDVDCNLMDGNTHQVALYGLDWDNYGPRAETVTVLDAGTNVALDSQSLTSFNNGTYLVWNIKGHVKFHIVNTAGSSTNAVLSALFFDAAH